MPFLVALVLAILILGLLVWAVQRFLPFDPIFKNLACFVLVLLFCLWLAGAVGWMPGMRFRY